MGTTLRCGAWASHCGDFSCLGARILLLLIIKALQQKADAPEHSNQDKLQTKMDF